MPSRVAPPPGARCHQNHSAAANLYGKNKKCARGRQTLGPNCPHAGETVVWAPGPPAARGGAKAGSKPTEGGSSRGDAGGPSGATAPPPGRMGAGGGGASDPGRPVRRCAGCAVASARARTGGSQRRAWMMRVRALRLGVRPRAHGRVPAARLDDAGAVGSRGDARIAPWVQCYDGQLQAFSSRERGNGKERSSPSSKRGWKCE